MSMAMLTIRTPPGASVRSGGAGAQLRWEPGFGARAAQAFTVSQKFLDSEVIRRMQPYTPLQTGTLIRSATLGTVIGSGRVKQTVPYAARQYYRTSATRAYDPRRGAKWFERMKLDHRSALLAETAKRMGAKPKP